MLSGAKHVRSISVAKIRFKIDPRFFASLRMTLPDGLPCANRETIKSDVEIKKAE